MKNIKIYLIAILASFSSISCLVDDEIDVNNENFNGSKIVGFKSDTTLGNFVQEAGVTFNLDVPVHFLGGGAGQPVGSTTTMSYEVGALTDLALSADAIADIAANQDAAIEGTHFDFADTVLESVIAANHTFDMIPLNIYNDALDAGKTTYVVLNLRTVVSVDDVVISNQLKSTLVQIQLCRTDLVGNYHIDFSSGTTNLTISEISPGLYRSSYLAPFSSTYSFDFTACAGALTIVGWEFNELNTSTASYYMTQGVPGYVEANGDITFEQVNMTDVSWYVNRNFTYIKD